MSNAAGKSKTASSRNEAKGTWEGPRSCLNITARGSLLPCGKGSRGATFELAQRDSSTTIRSAPNDGNVFMKKIGILFGQENSFPWAFIDRVNSKTDSKEIMAEPVRIDKVIQGEP